MQRPGGWVWWLGVNGALCRMSCPLFSPCWGTLSSHCIISKSDILLYHHCNLSLRIVCMCAYLNVCLWCGYDRTFDIFKAWCPVALLRCVCIVFPADLLCIKWAFCSLVATSKNRHMKANVNVHVCACACDCACLVLHSKRIDFLSLELSLFFFQYLHTKTINARIVSAM